MTNVSLVNVTDTVFDIPSIRHTAVPGVPFDCPVEIAGEVPGRWREPTKAEAAESCRGLVTRTKLSTTLEVRSPGTGLLATGNYELAPIPKVEAKKAADSAPTGSNKEGDN